MKAENSAEFRTNLERAFEDFYHQADLLEATIRLAQQQCLNTFASVASVSSSHIHFLTQPRNGPPRELFYFYMSLLGSVSFRPFHKRRTHFLI